MSGMVTSGRSRDFYIQPAYVQGHSTLSDENDDADQIIAQPDRFLLPQDQVFEAEGGWATCALTLGLGATGALLVMASNGKLSTYLGRGNLRFREWLQVSSAALLFGAAGQQIGIRACGDVRAYNAHWMAYTHIKAQNRYNQKYQLAAAPMFF